MGHYRQQPIDPPKNEARRYALQYGQLIWPHDQSEEAAHLENVSEDTVERVPGDFARDRALTLAWISQFGWHIVHVEYQGGTGEGVLPEVDIFLLQREWTP